MTSIETGGYTLDATGDVVAGDVIRFEEGVFGGSHRKPKHLGDRIIEARVLRESYGADKQQHTFSLEVIRSEGHDALKAGAVVRRKGRVVYRRGVRRQQWSDEAERRAAADEKHARGDAARGARASRIEFGG